MPFKRIFKTLVLVSLLCLLCVQSIIIFLPDISRPVVHSALDRLPGNLPLDFTVSRLGANEIQINDISLGDDLHLDTIRLTCHGDTKQIVSIEKIVISGLAVTLHLDEKNRVDVSGFSFPRDKKGGGDADNRADRPASHAAQPVFDISTLTTCFKYLPEQIVLKNSTLTVETAAEKVRFCVPVAADIQLDRNTLIGEVNLSLCPVNQQITLWARTHFTQGPLEMKISADRLCPELLLGMVPGAASVKGKLSGPVKVVIETRDFSTFQFKLNGLGIEPNPYMHIYFPDISGVFAYGDTAMKLEADGPVQFQIPGVDWGLFRFEILSRIASGTVDHFSFVLDNQMRQGKGESVWEMTPKRLTLPVGSTQFADQIQLFDPRFRLSVSGDSKHQTGALTVSGRRLKLFKHDTDSPGESLDLELSGVQINTGFNGNTGQPGALSAQIKLDALIDRIAFAKNQIRVNTASLRVGSDAKLAVTDSGMGIDPMELDAVCHRVTVGTKAVTALAGKVGITGTIEKPPSSGLSFHLTPVLSDTNVDVQNSAIQARDLYLELPVTYPFKAIKGKGKKNKNMTKAGRIGAGKIVLHEKIAPAVRAGVRQVSDRSVDILGTLTRTGIPGLTIDLSARVGLDADMNPFARAKMTVDKFMMTRDTLTPFVSDISFIDDLNMDISARADFSYANHQMASSGDLQVSNGGLNCGESDVSVSGVGAHLHFNDLLVPETLPGQYIGIGAFNAGRFNGNNGKVRFSIEDGTSVNIENLTFNWCNGIVSTEAFRVPPDGESVQLTLYCDRLEMESLFDQFGSFDAEGGGNLSGRIPVVIKDSQIDFDNGFLFSTPGEGGRIFIKNLDRLLAGIPMHTPEFSQLDLAGEALKNFEYNWVTLKLNSHGDTLAVNMQLDGKPLSVLPFEYNKEINAFVRCNAQSPGSNFQGIKLDVNLTLPFNQVMQFSSNLKRIINP